MDAPTTTDDDERSGLRSRREARRQDRPPGRARLQPSLRRASATSGSRCGRGTTCAGRAGSPRTTTASARTSGGCPRSSHSASTTSRCAPHCVVRPPRAASCPHSRVPPQRAQARVREAAAPDGACVLHPS
eukprot:415467-Prymnesium_polylepis.1